MSTFNGYLDEFPLIRIDAFRKLPGKPTPLACFLSHVHSDHLVGLESLKSPFVYCSAATREVLLRLERYPHRLDWALGILERRIQTYKHLNKILKPLPLETPTRLELCPGNEIQVTLFHANHCLGAVMFLIEGQGKAVLYTGDIRCEAWWLDNLTRNPVLLPYSAGLHKLDNIYLDTTFAVKDEPYRQFPSKVDGIKELLTKISAYPMQTIFYFRSWTFGYEDVWLAMSHFLKTSIHLDDYRYRIYTSISKNHVLATPESACLAGFTCGNHHHAGILTRDIKARIHSCEMRTRCPHLTDNPDVVEIIPVVSRHRGRDIREHGAGGGKGDLDQLPALDLSKQNVWANSQNPPSNPQLVEAFQKASTIFQTMCKGDFSRQSPPTTDMLHSVFDADSIKLRDVPALVAGIAKSINQKLPETKAGSCSTSYSTPNVKDLPKTITFPYSRHSSYQELRSFISAFKPADVYPCTAPSMEDWEERLSMSSLFGDLCDNPAGVFAFDEVMRDQKAELLGRGGMKRKRCDDAEQRSHSPSTESSCPPDDDLNQPSTNSRSNIRVKRTVVIHGNEDEEEIEIKASVQQNIGSSRHTLSASCFARLRDRREAFDAAEKGTWPTIGLTSLHDNDDDEDDDEL